MAGRVGLVLGLIAVVFVQLATAQKTFDVGDTTGWTVPSSETFYSNWAAKSNFSVGDSLRFSFQTSSHSVLEVEKESFDECNFNNTDDDIILTGPATVKLNETGMHYFVCTIDTHCSQGQKLSIDVSATAGGPTSPRPPSSQPPPRSPSSSNALMATLYLTFSAILMTFF